MNVIRFTFMVINLLWSLTFSLNVTKIRDDVIKTHPRLQENMVYLSINIYIYTHILRENLHLDIGKLW